MPESDDDVIMQPNLEPVMEENERSSQSTPVPQTNGHLHENDENSENNNQNSMNSSLDNNFEHQETVETEPSPGKNVNSSKKSKKNKKKKNKTNGQNVETVQEFEFTKVNYMVQSQDMTNGENLHQEKVFLKKKIKECK